MKRWSENTNYKKLIQSPRWSKVRCYYLSQHPRCEICGGLATEVHHIEPLDNFRNDLQMMEKMCFSESNLKSVCKDCHIKLHKELGKYKNLKQSSKEMHKEVLDRFFENYFS